MCKTLAPVLLMLAVAGALSLLVNVAGEDRLRPPSPVADISLRETAPADLDGGPDLTESLSAPDLLSPSIDEPVFSAPPDLPSLEVELLSAETGERLSGGRVSLRVVRKTTVPMVPREASFHLPEIDWPPGAWDHFEFEVEPPRGYVMEEPGSPAVSGRLSRFTRVIAARIVAWPHADLRVLVTEEDGRPAAGATVNRIFIQGATRGVPSVLTDASGRARVTGVPAIPGEPVRVFAGKEGRNGVSDWIPLERSTTETWAEVVLPREERPAWCYRGPGSSGMS